MKVITKRHFHTGPEDIYPMINKKMYKIYSRNIQKKISRFNSRTCILVDRRDYRIIGIETGLACRIHDSENFDEFKGLV